MKEIDSEGHCPNDTSFPAYLRLSPVQSSLLG